MAKAAGTRGSKDRDYSITKNPYEPRSAETERTTSLRRLSCFSAEKRGKSLEVNPDEVIVLAQDRGSTLTDWMMRAHGAFSHRRSSSRGHHAGRQLPLRCTLIFSLPLKKYYSSTSQAKLSKVECMKRFFNAKHSFRTTGPNQRPNQPNTDSL